MSHIVGQLTIIFARRKETGTQTAQHLSDEDITPSELDKYQVYARFVLLDTVSGYRSQYQEGACVISAR